MNSGISDLGMSLRSLLCAPAMSCLLLLLTVVYLDGQHLHISATSLATITAYLTRPRPDLHSSINIAPKAFFGIGTNIQPILHYPYPFKASTVPVPRTTLPFSESDNRRTTRTASVPRRVGIWHCSFMHVCSTIDWTVVWRAALKTACQHHGLPDLSMLVASCR